MLKFLFINLLFWRAEISMAADKTITNPNYISADPVSFGGIMNMVMGLFVVILLILALAWLMKKYGRLPVSNQVEMKVLGGLSLGTRDRAVLVQVEGKRLLLGVSPGRISTLMVMDEASQKTEATEFNQQLNQAIEQQS